MDIYYLLLYFFVYGFLGWCAEVGFAAFKEKKFVNRGFLNGPICPIYGVGVTIVVAFLMPIKSNFVLLYVTSVILVTVLEGITGWAMFQIFHHKWWDYSNIPFNIGGYVCLPFSIMWGIACVLIVDFVHPLIHRMLTFIPHTPGLVILVVLIVVTAIDAYVTASAIFKFNRHLASMDKIAAELHEISDQIGEDIYEKTMAAIERGEKRVSALEKHEKTAAVLEKKEKLLSVIENREKGFVTRKVSAEMRGRMEELHNRYAALKNKRHLVWERLLTAFPQMESGNYREQLHEFRKQVRKRKGMGGR